MIRLLDCPVVLGTQGCPAPAPAGFDVEQGREKTMAYEILKAHNQWDDMENLRLKFDALVSPDNNYVSILQTARASGIEKFPVPYVLSNCHNTLCAVGGTINEDDHVFGLSNVKRYGGIFVPPYRAVLHQYMREMMAGCGKMILGSDSHTRYGALGTMGIGEGGGEVAKQLLGRTYDLKRPPVIAVWLEGSPKPGVGPMDVALTLVGATFANGFNKNKILEFVGPGVGSLSVEYRMGIDVMTTESAALSSIWTTDGAVESYLKMHGRGGEYRPLAPGEGACYDGLIEIDLSAVECMIALPFHPSRALPIRELKENLDEIVAQVEAEGQRIKGEAGEPFHLADKIRDGELVVDQALVSGCSGGMFENIAAMADILDGCAISGNGISLGVNPASVPVMADLMDQGIAGRLAVSGATLRPAICGPCFGVTDVPANNQLSIRHVTRNYPNRDGSKPGQGQMAAVALMDARSIAATVRNGGRLTAATELDQVHYSSPEYHFNPAIYKGQVYDNFGGGNPAEPLVMGPNIGEWPEMAPLAEHLLLKVAGAYDSSVTTDELVPSGEASSYRSNPEKLAGYTLISRDPGYVGRAREVRAQERLRREMGLAAVTDQEAGTILRRLQAELGCEEGGIALGSIITGPQIGDGSSREQAASSQKVLGGLADLAGEYATKRYRSNLINWGILPLVTAESLEDIRVGDYLLVPGIRSALKEGRSDLQVRRVTGVQREISCTLGQLTEEERKILLSGCLINYYAQERRTMDGGEEHER